MRIVTEYMSFKHRWTISSSYHFQEQQQSSQRRCCFSQTAILWCKVLPELLPALPGLPPALPGPPRLVVGTPMCSQTYYNHSPGTAVPVIRHPSYSEGRPECSPKVSFSPQIDASKFPLRLLSHTPGGSQWLKYILLLCASKVCVW